MTMRFAVLGAGRIGQVHARAILGVPEAKLVAIAEPNEAVAERAARTYGCDIRSIEDCAQAEDVDAVLICTPTDTHADLIERFARSGKGIFCEKPVDLSVQRAKTCLKVVEEIGTALMIGFQRRFDPDFRALKAVIDGRRIGDVEMVTLTSRDPGPPPYDYIVHSGGIFRDMTIHDFDMARWLLGEEIEKVQAAASVLVDSEIGKRGDFDSANVILTTASGRQCTISNSRRGIWLRPAYRGAGFNRHRLGGEPPGGEYRDRRPRRAP
jgi:myo-inositol 2-dehydrogenase/D-chiro-inositol 1-dehydrogenase